ncbi:glycosyltransferase [Paenibacillus cymbidii]|uniref:glycosyltransferase n=1 Tax=Paenibacillus cymbidii TaxID=1639034 RepID=UPI0010819E03|nr:glycosyltransferase [Paenibacillus cymbidii]
MNRPLNVLWLTQSYPTEHEPVGGIFHRTQARELARLGVRVDVVAPVPWVPPLLGAMRGKWARYKETPQQYQDGAITVHRPRYLVVPRSDRLLVPHHLLLAQRLRALGLPAPDIVHAHFAYPYGMAALHMNELWRAPTVLTLHGSDVNVFPDVNGLSRKRFVRAVTGPDAVLAVSGALARRTKLLTGREPLVRPVGINLQPYRELPGRTAARRLLGLPESKRLVLYVGNLLEAKGIRDLLAALLRLDAEYTRAVFVGGGPLQGEVERCPLAVAAGVQPNERIPLYMAAADVLVLPSYREGLPTVLVEAGAARLPVVATNVGGIPELLEGGRGACVPTGSPGELADAIRTALLEGGPAVMQAARLQRYVETHYDAERNAADLLALYERVQQTHYTREVHS